MHPLIKLTLTLVLIFASTFVIIKMTGILTTEDIKYWLENAKQHSTHQLMLITIMLLWLDIFIAMPTLTIILLSGYFLGPVVAILACLFGTTLAGTTGYWLCRIKGQRLFTLLIPNSEKRHQASNTFKNHGVVMILLARAAPILPEASACLAGMYSMRWRTFITVWLTSTIPYVGIAAYAGSISSISQPTPAILTAIILSAFFWLAWFSYIRRNRKLTV